MIVYPVVIFLLVIVLTVIRLTTKLCFGIFKLPYSS